MLLEEYIPPVYSVHISVLFVTGILERCSKQQFVNSLEI